MLIYALLLYSTFPLCNQSVYCKLIHINVTCIHLPQTVMYGTKHNGFNMYLYNVIVSDNKTDFPSAKLTKIEEQCLKIEKNTLGKLVKYLQVEKTKLDIMKAKFDMKRAEKVTSLFLITFIESCCFLLVSVQNIKFYALLWTHYSRLIISMFICGNVQDNPSNMIMFWAGRRFVLFSKRH